MSSFPRTLIQIHYHDRPCGVMQAVRSWARAFASAGGGENILVCAHDPGAQADAAFQGRVLSLPEAGYRDFRSACAFRSARGRMVRWLTALLLSPGLRTPVTVAAHNLTLCKNGALASAFAELARTFGAQVERYRFFSVAHDFAGEGRADRLEEVRRLELLGIDIREDLSAAGAPVHFVTVNERAKGALSRAGVPASFLAASVETEGEGSDEDAGRPLALIRRHARQLGVPFAAGRPIFAYPARTILRKNPFEAVAFACVLMEANLLLGGAGSGSLDRRRHEALKRLIREFRLPAVSDIQEVLSASVPEGANPVPGIYAVSDTVLTTSVSEGFGYLLHEPWLYGKGVTGRRPAGFSFPEGIIEPPLYDRLPVPGGLVNIRELKEKYASMGGRCFSLGKEREEFVRRVGEMLGKERLDFAILDEASQRACIAKACSSPMFRDKWRALLEGPQPGWPGLSAVCRVPGLTVRMNRRAVARQCSMSSFVKKFREVMSTVPRLIDPGKKRSGIGVAFADPRLFRIA